MSFFLSILLFGLAVLAAFASGIWLLVLAFQKRIWWGLAVLFLPLAHLVFTIVEWQTAKRPFFLSLLMLPLCVGAWFALPKDHPAFQAIVQHATAQAAEAEDITASGGYATEAAPAPSQPAQDPAAEIEAQLAALAKKESALLARKKALDPRDKASALALSHEIVAYNAELQDTLAQRQRLVGSGALLVPARTPAAGQIAGQPFTVEKATLKDGILTLRQGGEFFADREVAIFLFLKKGENVTGRKWEVAAGRDSSHPHVHFSWRDAGQSLPKTKILMNDYRMHLEFAQERDGAVTGQIALSAPGEQNNRVNGTFSAQLAAQR